MTNYTLTYRQVGKHLHILNYSLGEIMSFENEDGYYLLNNLDNLSNANVDIDREVCDFLSYKGESVMSRKFRSSLVNLGMDFSFPTVTNIEINRRCVLRCQHCYIPVIDLASKSDSTFEEQGAIDTKMLLDALQQLSVFLIVLTGGEVFLNRKLKSLITDITERGFIIEIFSSLQFLPEWFKELNPIESRIGRIQTSVYSVTPPVHDEVTGVEGAMVRTLENLQRLHRNGFYVEVATPLLSLNFDRRYEIEDYFKKAGITQMFSYPIVSEYYDGVERKSLLNITKAQFLEFCREKPDYLIKVDPMEYAEEPVCAAGKAVFSISANGDVFPCSQFPRTVGNIRVEDIKTVYESNPMQSVARYKMTDIPSNAMPYNFCIGNNWSETGDPLQQPDFMRDMLSYYESNQRGGESDGDQEGRKGGGCIHEA